MIQHSAKAILWKINNQFKDYTIKIDRRLSTTFKVLESKHHLIPTTFELIPNITVKWTIDWLLLKEIESSYKIVDKTLYINQNLFLHLTIAEHKQLHEYLDYQKRALYYSVWLENEIKTHFAFSNDELVWYSFYPSERHHQEKKDAEKIKVKEQKKQEKEKKKIEKKAKVKIVKKKQLIEIPQVNFELKYKILSSFWKDLNDAQEIKKNRDNYYQKQIYWNWLKNKAVKMKVTDLIPVIKKNYNTLKNLVQISDKLFEVWQTKLYDSNVLVLDKSWNILLWDFMLSYLLNKDEIDFWCNKKKNIKDLEINVYTINWTEKQKHLNNLMKF